MISLTTSGSTSINWDLYGSVQVGSTSYLVLSGNGAFLQSGVVTAQPGAFYEYAESNAMTASSFATVSGTIASTDFASKLADNRVKLTLTSGFWRSSLNSGLFGFESGVNATAILSGIAAGSIQFASPNEIIITPASGLVADTTLSGLVNSGAFIQVANDPSVAIASSRVATLSGVAVGANTDATNVTITYSGVFKSNTQGFSPADVIFAGSGVAGSSGLAQANYAASVLNAEMAMGNYTISGGTITVTLSENLTTIADTVYVTIKAAAILFGSTDAGRDQGFTATR